MRRASSSAWSSALQSVPNILSGAGRAPTGALRAHRSSAAAISRYSAVYDYFSGISQSPASGTQFRVRSGLIFTSSDTKVIARRHERTSLYRAFHSSIRALDDPRRPNESKSSGSSQSASSNSSSSRTDPSPEPPPSPPPHPTHTPIKVDFSNYSSFFRQLLAQSVPHAVHRPTRDDLLNLTNNFWERLKIRFKWLTIRSFRKFNADDLSAFFSFALVGQTVWILVGTTTFVSVIIWLANSLRLQSYLARSLSDYMTQETGISVIFESAIVPSWGSNSICFRNVYISRRPPSVPPPPPSPLLPSSGAVLGKRAAARIDVGHGHGYFHDEHDHEEDEGRGEVGKEGEEEEDLNYSMFDLNVDSIEVTLSVAQWLDGKGLVKDLVVRGVRGVLDRRNVTYDPDSPPIPSQWRHEALPGDFHISSTKLEDVLITVYQPFSFRPYTISIFRADLNRLRKQWMCLDFLMAEAVTGQIDGCLFSLHRPQGIGRTVERDMEDVPWARMSRFRIDGLPIDHLKASTDPSLAGPINWITSGKFDAVLDFKFPPSTSPSDEEFDLNEVVAQIAKNISMATLEDRLPGQRVLAKPALSAPEPDVDEEGGDGDGGEEGEGVQGRKGKLRVLVDVDLRFRDVKADVPLFTSDLSRVNSALIRPIVAFINANRTLVPIHCRVSQDLSDFDGSWTLWETGLLDSLALKTYDALAYHVTQANMNRRIKTVTLWSLQQTAKAALRTLKVAIEPLALPMHAQLVA